MKPKGRPKKKRKIEREPIILQFSPRGKPGRPDETEIKYEELEALRLKDLLGLKQSEAAKKMNISRQSFGRILNRARKEAADALVNGKIIRIIGGKDYSIL